MGRLESFNPATAELIGVVETVEPAAVDAIVAEVATVQAGWADAGLDRRAQVLRRVAAVLLDELDEVAELLTREQGKPLVESYTMEVIPSVDALCWCAGAGRAVLRDERSPFPQVYLKAKRGRFRFEPIGVVGVIAPWNYPWSTPFTEVALALLAGNGVVFKPSSLTPLTGERIVAAFERGGVPRGLVRCIHGGGTAGEAICESPGVGKVFFTGSVDIGRHVGELCARNLKGSVLELGGKDPQIVCSDANIELAASGCAWGAFANAGQTCSGIERTYVTAEVADEFSAAVVAKAAALKVGDPGRWETEVGPMISRDQRDRVWALVEEAVADGAAILTGGPLDRSADGLPGAFIAPTVLSGVNERMRIMRDETFGPVVPIVVVADEREALARANDSRFGLGASVWTRDRIKGERIAAELEAGSVWINDHAFTHGTCQCSWGGVKDSGLGRTHSKFGLYECVNVKHVSWEPGLVRNFWWHPYDRVLGDSVRALARVIYGRNGRAAALREGASPLAKLGSRLARRG